MFVIDKDRLILVSEKYCTWMVLLFLLICCILLSSWQRYQIFGISWHPRSVSAEVTLTMEKWIVIISPPSSFFNGGKLLVECDGMLSLQLNSTFHGIHVRPSLHFINLVARCNGVCDPLTNPQHSGKYILLISPCHAKIDVPKTLFHTY